MPFVYASSHASVTPTITMPRAKAHGGIGTGGCSPMAGFLSTPAPAPRRDLVSDGSFAAAGLAVVVGELFGAVPTGIGVTALVRRRGAARGRPVVVWISGRGVALRMSCGPTLCPGNGVAGSSPAFGSRVVCVEAEGAGVLGELVAALATDGAGEPGPLGREAGAVSPGGVLTATSLGEPEVL